MIFRTLLSVILLVFLGACEPPRVQKQSRFKIQDLLRDTTESFKKVQGERAFYFPKDHGPHFDFRQESWYLSGNLHTDDNRPFGFQLTFFRMAATSVQQKRDSKWAPKHVYMGHFAITDVKNKKFYAFERLARDAQSLAGAKLFPFRIWVEDWQLYSSEENEWPWHLVAQQQNVGISLKLDQGKPMVLQGDKGLSIKSSSGEGSYYYSAPRLLANGTIYIDGDKFPVTGTVWLDREWSSSAVAKNQEGWDWFALQMQDKTELMFYRIRNKDGGIDDLSQGVYIDYNGEKKVLKKADVDIEILKTWTSPTGRRYPAHWKFTIKKLRKSFEVIPLIPNQELLLSTHYWEGAVKVMESNREYGQGYVELVGY